MTWGEALESINYIAVVAGTFSTLVWGAIWYSSKVFEKDWAKLVGLKKKDLQNTSGMPVMMVTSLVFYFIACTALAALMQLTDMITASEGLLLGAIMGFVFGFGPMAVTYGFARRRLELALIDGGYIVVALATAGFIIGQIGG